MAIVEFISGSSAVERSENVLFQNELEIIPRIGENVRLPQPRSDNPLDCRVRDVKHFLDKKHVVVVAVEIL